ncbi:MAG: type VI secretion system baseplate subunit TssK [Paracoccaceae bacterium]|nr:type VI secretion system baseplate subunit TssK [Paracoccaceae bacterium]
MAEWHKVIWSEGMFLRQQHFQRQDRYTDWLFNAARMVGGAPAFGFETLEIDPAALGEGRISIDRARGIFPDGTPFDIPGTAAIPPPLVFTADSATGTVSLSIPEARADSKVFDRAGEATSGARYAGLFDDTARDITVNTGAAEQIEVATLAPRLDAPDAEMDRRVSLAVADVQSVSATGEIRLNSAFLLPALTIGATPNYARLIRELIVGFEQAVAVHAKAVHGQTAGGYESLLKLELANAALGRLRHIGAQDTQHPSELYGYLAELAGRLATYETADMSMRPLPDYVHAHPQGAFTTLLDTIRPLLASLAHHTPKYTELETTKRGDNIWAIRLDNPEVLRNGSVILRVMSDMSPETVAHRFTDAIIAGAAEFQTHWAQRKPGVSLKELRSHPRDVPRDGEAVCLEFDQSSNFWADAAKPPGFALGIIGTLPDDPRLNCYVVYR